MTRLKKEVIYGHILSLASKGWHQWIKRFISEYEETKDEIMGAIEEDPESTWLEDGIRNEKRRIMTIFLWMVEEKLTI